jgi:Co/Zn/Cd efflux system component
MERNRKREAANGGEIRNLSSRPAVVALGLRIADPVIGLVITLVILRITWESWHTVRNAEIDLQHIDHPHHEH